MAGMWHEAAGMTCIHPSLAEDPGELARLIVAREDRPHRFGLPVVIAPDTPPSHRLLAFLGRDPR